MKRAFFCTLILALLVALPVAAAGVRAIESGIDVWHTPGDGTTFVDFARNPIPKGFFCAKSGSFTGRIVLQGRPLTTGTPGELGGADTIVQRLDDAAFDASGVTTTRVQLRALQLESVAPVKTACGSFNVRVVLNGTQPISQMKIIKETEVGGRFEAPIRVNFTISFFPVKGAPTQRLELTRGFSLLPAPNATWGAIEKSRFRPARTATLLVDTDGDQVPDTYLPKTSGNFVPGWGPEWQRELRARQSRGEKILAAQPIECRATDTTYSYDGYGSYQCNSGTDPQCHPEAEQSSSHCAQSCPPCQPVAY